MSLKNSEKAAIAIGAVAGVVALGSLAVVAAGPIKRFSLDVGVTVFGAPSYFAVSDALTEFQNFVESHSKFLLNLHVAQLDSLLPLSEFTADMENTSNCTYPDLGKLDSSILAYFVYPVNIVLFDDEGTIPCFGGLTWVAGYYGKSVCIVPFGANISWWPIDLNWVIGIASAITHEFLNGIGVDPDDNCRLLGYTGSNDPGWISCYSSLLAQLSDKDYQQIVNGIIVHYP